MQTQTGPIKSKCSGVSDSYKLGNLRLVEASADKGFKTMDFLAHHLNVLESQLVTNGLQVTQRIHSFLDMDDVLVLEYS